MDASGCDKCQLFALNDVRNFGYGVGTKKWRSNMPKTVKVVAGLLQQSSNAASLSCCGCGFDCKNGNSNNPGPTLLSLGFSDSLPEELKQVVIEVDSITFRRNNADDVVVDSFTIEALDLVEADTFQIDLLQYRGRNQLTVIEDLELDAGTYSEILVTVLDGDINLSYVQEDDDTLKEITVPAGGLSLESIELTGDEQVYTVEFGLAQSLQYQASDDNYLMTTDGIRLEDNALAASLSGRVDSDLFDTVSPCDAKEDPEQGNRIYLYEGSGLTDTQLADVFTSDSSTQIPDNALAPFAVASLVKNTLTGSWEYAFGFLPAGEYTMAFACDTADDDAVEFDDLVIPLPEDQVYEITLEEAQQSVCDLADGAKCQ
jgi:hypothetical protein